MKNKNICKFITNHMSANIKTTLFIFESNHDAMNLQIKLSTNRMILIKQGTGSFVIDKKTYTYSAGIIIFGFTGETIYALPDTETEYMYIDFSGDRADELFKRFCIHENNRIHPKLDGLIPLWHDSVSRANEKNINLIAESMVLYTFSRFDTPSKEDNSIINKVISLTEENYTDHTLSLSSVAEMLSYNKKYISHIFKKKMGVSYTDYLKNLRIKNAVTLLDLGIDSVKNVAFLSGYSDPLYFSAVFKQVVGISPKEYKSKSRNGEQI